MKEKRCNTCCHSIGYTSELIVCHVGGELLRFRPIDSNCGLYEPKTDAKEREE